MRAGEFARRMSELGGHVLAVDFSDGMVERARAHRGARSTTGTRTPLTRAAILALGEPASFDAVVSNMAIMDMESIERMVTSPNQERDPSLGSAPEDEVRRPACP
jgi:ubiquinone/menaquinone biosynthesis C-methylase UbiE